MLFDAPPSIGGNLRRAVDEIAAANGVTNTVTHLVYSHHHADHGAASSLFDGDVVRIGHEETRRLLLRDDDPSGRCRRTPGPGSKATWMPSPSARPRPSSRSTPVCWLPRTSRSSPSPPPSRSCSRCAWTAGPAARCTPDHNAPGAGNAGPRCGAWLVNTVSTHIRSIYAKLQMSDRSSAVQRARELRPASRSRLALAPASPPPPCDQPRQPRRPVHPGRELRGAHVHDRRTRFPQQAAHPRRSRPGRHARRGALSRLRPADLSRVDLKIVLRS